MDLGGELWELATELIKANIRNENPGISREELQRKLKKRLTYEQNY